ncbi:hypothetical protein [Psychroflexus halocasei]|uniref:Uncharacterized protein n=1 Tax=Psychroflexus halocasei TaxID=908615 RepID=A0A1H3ZJU4_9FLAO|nr:hypothetical protein [Psychroflexus halocasei]SEA23930.1 hypothetical protein SAMN05421540_104102 [Psychroflexus halocasei]
MSGQTILLIVINFILSVGLSYFLYQKYLKDKNKWMLAIFRFLSFFIIGLIIIDLTAENKSVFTEKPQLLLAIDDSQSIAHLGDTTQVKSALNNFENHKELNDKFDLNMIKFSQEVDILDRLTFTGQQTDISSVIDFYQSDDQENTAFVLLSDGRQTVGVNYAYQLKKSNSKQNFALVVGDTVQHPDLSIEMLNVNQFAFLNNNFPIEVFVNYKGDQSVSKKLILYQNDKRIKSKVLEFKVNSALSHTFYVNANQVGSQSYKVEIESLSEENNISNNQRLFGIDVIDNRYKIVIVSDFIHPDIGALKSSIESNEQNEVQIKSTSEISSLEDVNLFIFYQPQAGANSLFKKVIQNESNFMLFLGTSTDYSLINSLDLGFRKSASGVDEDYFGKLNSDFSLYQFEDLNFESFPPLKSDFSNLQVTDQSENILMSKIQNTITDSPLFFVIQKGEYKRSVFGAENIWKWKAKSYRNNSDFEKFNTFINQHIQFLASNEPKERLSLTSESFYNQGLENEIKAKYYDANFKFDSNADLELQIKNSETDEVFTSQMLLKNQEYTSNISQLAPGEYQANLTVGSFSKEIRFQILAYNPEKTSKNADINSLKNAFDEAHLYPVDKHEKLIQTLLNSDQFYNVESQQTKSVSLIEIKYLLIILVFLLSIEWFFRKYLGLI